MTCHPAYFSLNYDELLLGENVTDEEFWARYTPAPVGRNVLQGQDPREAPGDMEQGAGRTEGDGAEALPTVEGAE